MAEQSASTPTGLGLSTQHSDTLQVTVRYFGAARAAAGVPEESLVLPASEPVQGLSVDPPNAARGRPRDRTTVGEVLDAATQRHGSGLDRVLQRCSFLLDEVAAHGRQTLVGNGQVLDVLPPFAGG